MQVGSGVVGGPASSARVALERRSRDHLFFTAMAGALAIVAFVGFAQSYYLRFYFGGREISRLVHVHGILSTAWMLLFLAQTSLVAVRRVDLHRRLGILGAVLLVALPLVGYVTAIEAARHGVTPPGGPPPLAFLAIPLGTISAFTILAAAGLYYRRRPETHKRLMLLATIAMVMPALARMRWLGPGGPPVAIGGTLAFLAVCLGYDRLWNGRVHPAFAWGGLFLALSIVARFATARTERWLPIAEWLVR
jgi:uncharacterized membrane protein YozB (DUF420 family)